MSDPTDPGPDHPPSDPTLRAHDRLVPAAPSPAPRDSKRRPARSGAGRAAAQVLGGFAGLAMTLAMVGAVLGAAAAYGVYLRYSTNLPTVDGLRAYQPKVMTRLYAADSRLISELASERRIFIPASAIPPLVSAAFIAAEDQNFETHHGIDPLAIARAAVGDLAQMGRGRRPVGASTITQQVARNMLLGSNELSIERKVREALLALRIEQTLPKDKILEIYLNEIYLGLHSYGVAAAAQTYFNKSLDDLTIQEAAFLAALPKAPNNYNPFRFPEAARIRRDWVIDRMVDTHAITAAQGVAAKAAPLVPAPYQRPEFAPGADWFAEEVRRELLDHYAADKVTGEGLTVRTSLDAGLQQAADTALRHGLMAYDRARGGWRGPVARLGGGAAVAQRWRTDLADAARPPGMLASWRLAEVIEAGDGEAKLGLIEPPAEPGGPAVAQVLPMFLADTAWARPALPMPPPAAAQPYQTVPLGPVPRHMSDIVHPGDIVMVEPTSAPRPSPAKGAAPPPGGPRLLLRQIPKVQGALVSLDPTTGRVLAMTGGWSFANSQFNRATQAARQPGSSFKPFVYLTAMEANIPPSQLVSDAPYSKDMGRAGIWSPGNFEGTFGPPVPLRVALEQSLNVAAVRLAERLGMNAVANTAIAFHMADKMPRVLPAALGAVETTLLREAGAYASLAMGGRAVVPTLVDSVQDRQGRLIFRAPGLSCVGCDDPAQPPSITDSHPQIADPASVFQLVTMMQGVAQRGTATRAAAGLGHAIAAKTGTSQDFSDAWLAGFTRDLVTVVWIGFDARTSLGRNQTGGELAAPVWHEFMETALKGRPNLVFPVPDGVALASWDSGSGTVTDAFKPDQPPGASGPVIGGGEAPAASDAPAAPDGAPAANSVGVDTNLGGVY